MKLEALQGALAKKKVLTEADINISIGILNDITRVYPTADYSKIKAPAENGKMYPLSELAANSTGSLILMPGAIKALHRSVSVETYTALRIPTLEECFTDEVVDRSFDQDFEQREDPVIAINDALRRYAISSTFNEYLANAEDCGTATSITWTLDRNDSYPSMKLLAPQLKEAHGEALFCHNDAVFTEDDYATLINIGVSSKKPGDNKIGKFGRGALTMYHWSWVPMMVSGEYLVIFDPQRTRLPRNTRTRKPRAGVRIKISEVRRNWPDQLGPFEGMHGFNKDTTYYYGTLYRFPLLKTADKTQITQTLEFRISPDDVARHLMDYYDTAKISLLFLSRIKRINFQIRGTGQVEWEVSMTRESFRKGSPVDIVKVDTKKRDTSVQVLWHVLTKQDVIPIQMKRLAGKHKLEARFGIAATIADIQHSPAGTQLFMGVPLRGAPALELPVHVTAVGLALPLPFPSSNSMLTSENRTWLFRAIARQFL